MYCSGHKVVATSTVARHLPLAPANRVPARTRIKLVSDGPSTHEMRDLSKRSSAVSTGASRSPTSGVTLRAFVTGALLSAGVAVGIPYGSMVVQGTRLGLSSSTPAAFFLLFIFLLSVQVPQEPGDPGTVSFKESRPQIGEALQNPASTETHGDEHHPHRVPGCVVEH